MAVRAPGGALKWAYAGLVFKIVFDKVFSIYILHSSDSVAKFPSGAWESVVKTAHI